MTENRHLAQDLGDFALYRRLRNWCLLEGTPITATHLWRGVGPYCRVEQELKDHPAVEPEVLSISVEADTMSAALEISVVYLWGMGTDRESRTVNPVVSVTNDGRVIRTHGDFHRLRRWVEALGYSSDFDNQALATITGFSMGPLGKEDPVYFKTRSLARAACLRDGFRPKIIARETSGRWVLQSEGKNLRWTDLPLSHDRACGSLKAIATVPYSDSSCKSGGLPMKES